VVVADVPGAEGVIGPDVFASYLIDIDLAQMRLRLSPLPKRPEDAVAPTALNSEVEEETGADGEVSLGQTSAGKNSSDAEDRSTPVVPKDRYIAPEMANWTRVFRFGHMLLIPTIVSDSKPMLFLLDTGAVGSVLSLHAAQLVSKVHSENRVHLRGLSGAVSNVYSSKNVTLRFGHLEQKNKDIIAVDLTNMSRLSGTEISGVLGFLMLTALDVKLDYRDGLADFEYNRKDTKH
jgi:hypothetical protein